MRRTCIRNEFVRGVTETGLEGVIEDESVVGGGEWGMIGV